MENYHLELNDVDEFIPQLANEFGCDFSEHLGEFQLKIPESKGRGTIKGINFPNGIGLYTYHCKLNTDINLAVSQPFIKPIRFIYCVKGEVESYFNKKEDLNNITDHQFLIAAPKDNEVHNLNFIKDRDIIMCYLEIDRLKFQQYFSFDLHDLEPVFYKIFSDIEALNRISETGSFSLKTADAIKEIRHCDATGFPRVNFIGAKALEVLSYMLARFKKESQRFENTEMREKDRKAIETAVNYIDSNISQTGTVNDLAQIAGVNTNKLQEGFQAIYGKTVNGYIRDVRLSKSLTMLSAGNKNVSEVVYELGLSSRSYFSKIFKAKYGVSPRKVLSGRSISEKFHK
ncbi:helix-turn-helix transcriptional regulator [Christiangramia sediminis]|uniref:AraC family transcriptional regulator n=1 Tax=Christiangramia sediminis TaxID=2881336 RepID=A0A9X1LHP7_9FLAO|nr:AraC family transcriptional regulator [Christiangramia sediminis]MCB7480571.1 AraC family transcriptional regulator [Christiangramia sediminis]